MDETFTPAVVYRDARAALDWLARAFGFEVTMAIEGDDPYSSHYEMSAAGGHGRIMIGGEWADWTRSPAAVGGANTQVVSVALDSDVDAHCARAREAGATILAEPEDQFYGARTYRAADLEGHVWTFAQHVRDVSRAEAEAAHGHPIEAPSWT